MRLHKILSEEAAETFKGEKVNWRNIQLFEIIGKEYTDVDTSVFEDFDQSKLYLVVIGT